MSRLQQDKSKENIIATSPFPSPQTTELSSSCSQVETTISSASFFDKFKKPDYHLNSSFRLCKPLTQNILNKVNKKTVLIRKHRGNYRKYTVAEKEQAVKQILAGVDAKKISQKYGIPRRNLLRWKKNGCQRKEGGGRPTDGEMEVTLYNKIDSMILTNQKEIRAEAKRLSKMAEFKASKGWYCKFSRRYNQWKKQESKQTMDALGQGEGLQKEIFLLPQVSEGFDSQSQSQSQQDSAKDEE